MNDLSVEELKILIDSSKDKNKKTRLEHKLKVEITRYYKNDFISFCNSIINQIGYTQNTLFKNEVLSIINKFDDEIKSLYYRCNTEEIIGLSLVTEILDFYLASYNEEEIYKIYNIDKNVYFDTKLKLNNLLKIYYWNK